ncbi:MAG: quinol:cytochrome C oxidoreductase [Planctomycetota bacterium]
MKVITEPENPSAGLRIGEGARTVTLAAAACGGILVAIPLALGDWEHFLRSYLVSFSTFLSIALGGLFFVLLQHLTGSSWSVVVRRLAEAIAANVVLLAVLFVPLVAGMNSLYHWMHPAETDHLLLGKTPWLNSTFFLVRCAVYFGVWTLSARWLLSVSVKQDETGDPALTAKLAKGSPGLMVLYALTVTFAAFDILMSLDPHWYSTIYGAYFFSAGMVGFFAFLAITLFVLQWRGKLAKEVTEEHWHDIGKQLFGWNVFWAYIAFSQYMLIWYANIPEETVWYETRQHGGWGTVSLVLLFGHFLVPFVLMLPRTMKRKRAAVMVFAVWLLLMHYVDMVYLVVPEAGSGTVPFGVTDVLGFLGHLGLFVAGVTYTLSGHSLLPGQDPRLAESLAFENV